MKRIILAAGMAWVASAAFAADAPPLSVPARLLPAPTSDDISPEMQALIANQPRPQPIVTDVAAARAAYDKAAATSAARVPETLKRLSHDGDDDHR